LRSIIFFKDDKLLESLDSFERGRDKGYLKWLFSSKISF
jgi:hypothetical protein